MDHAEPTRQQGTARDGMFLGAKGSLEGLVGVVGSMKVRYGLVPEDDRLM